MREDGTCKNCKWFTRMFECRRHAPVILKRQQRICDDKELIYEDFWTTWPRVKKDDFCGEFKKQRSDK